MAYAIGRFNRLSSATHDAPKQTGDMINERRKRHRVRSRNGRPPMSLRFSPVKSFNHGYRSSIVAASPVDGMSSCSLTQNSHVKLSTPQICSHGDIGQRRQTESRPHGPDARVIEEPLWLAWRASAGCRPRNLPVCHEAFMPDYRSVSMKFNTWQRNGARALSVAVLNECAFLLWLVYRAATEPKPLHSLKQAR